MPHSLPAIVAALFVLLAATVAPSQATYRAVVPAGFDNVEANGGTLWLTTTFESRSQLLVGAGHLAGHSGRLLTGIALRRDNDDPSPTRAGRLSVELWLSNTRIEARAASPLFARNRGTDHQLAFKAEIALPVVVAWPTSPAPWQAPHSVRIPLQTPFQYGGATLCIEAVTRHVTPPDAPWFAADCQIESPTGSVQSLGSSCIPQLEGQPAVTSDNAMAIGSTAVFGLGGRRTQGVGLLTLGTQRIDLSLAAFGAPGCTAYSDWLISVPVSLSALPFGYRGHAQVDLPLPVNPGFINLRLVAQWVLIDWSANRLGLSFSNGLEATLGPPSGLGISWVEAFTAAATSGRVIGDRSPVLELTFRAP